MSVCDGKDCDAQIVWAENPATRTLQPFDREPTPDGNRVLLGRGPNRPPLAIDAKLIDPGPGMLGNAIDECRYMPHHATCPNAEDYRRR